MPLISHCAARGYVIALSGKSLNNSRPPPATKLGPFYIGGRGGRPPPITSRTPATLLLVAIISLSKFSSTASDRLITFHGGQPREHFEKRAREVVATEGHI